MKHQYYYVFSNVLYNNPNPNPNFGILANMSTVWKKFKSKGETYILRLLWALWKAEKLEKQETLFNFEEKQLLPFKKTDSHYYTQEPIILLNLS